VHVIQGLCRLSAVDQEWDEKRRAYLAVRQRLSDASALEARRKAQQDLEGTFVSKRSALRDGELELASLQVRVRNGEGDLYAGRILQPRELDNLRRDVEQLKQRIAHLEESVLSLMQDVDELGPQVAEGQESLRLLEAGMAAERERDTQLQLELGVRLQALQAERATLRSGIEPNALALYDELRKSRGGVPLAAQRDGQCQVCRVSVPVAKAQLVERGDESVVLCVGCGRILYRG
jgi:predicted  nucleic acid-binding Zn-ribbon protein